MDKDPWYIGFLEKLGVNTTQLKWRLYRMQQKKERAVKSKGVPGWLQWLTYEHKICGHCGAINDRKERVCHSCEQKLPSVLGYRLQRVIGLMTPTGSPVTSTVFIMACSLMFGAMLVLEGMSALMRPSSNVLMMLGGFSNRYLETGTEWWRWLSFGLVHGSIMHIGFNMYALVQIGPIVENQMGRKRMLVMITVCQLTSAAATVIWYDRMSHHPFLTIGASGWVCGLVGYGVAFFHRLGDAGRPYRDALLRWVAIILMLGMFFPMLNSAAHIGGMLGGAAMAYIPEARNTDSVRRSEQIWDTLFLACMVLWTFALIFVGRFALTHLALLQNG